MYPEVGGKVYLFLRSRYAIRHMLAYIWQRSNDRKRNDSIAAQQPRRTDTQEGILLEGAQDVVVDLPQTFLDVFLMASTDPRDTCLPRAQRSSALRHDEVGDSRDAAERVQAYEGSVFCLVTCTHLQEQIARPQWTPIPALICALEVIVLKLGMLHVLACNLFLDIHSKQFAGCMIRCDCGVLHKIGSNALLTSAQPVDLGWDHRDRWGGVML